MRNRGRKKAELEVTQPVCRSGNFSPNSVVLHFILQPRFLSTYKIYSGLQGRNTSWGWVQKWKLSAGKVLETMTNCVHRWCGYQRCNHCGKQGRCSLESSFSVSPAVLCLHRHLKAEVQTHTCAMVFRLFTRTRWMETFKSPLSPEWINKTW